MLRFVLLFILILCPFVISKRKSQKNSDASGDDLGGSLVSALRNDVNIDLPEDEEYEDLRAELLAYHSALASITSGRRSMKTTPCWQLGGICIHHNLCTGHYSLTEIAGCRRNLEVCCFTWNKFNVRDMRDQGISVMAMPWPGKVQEFGGKGVLDPPILEKKKKKNNHVKKSKIKHQADIPHYGYGSYQHDIENHEEEYHEKENHVKENHENEYHEEEYYEKENHIKANHEKAYHAKEYHEYDPYSIDIEVRHSVQKRPRKKISKQKYFI